MRVHLVNPSDMSFGTAVITPRWLFVLAAATPEMYGPPVLVDETLEPFDPATIAAGDVVGIGIHTGNALRGYKIGRSARARGASSSTAGSTRRCSPMSASNGARPTRWSAATATSSGRRAGGLRRGPPRRRYDGGRVEGDAFLPARWDLLSDRIATCGDRCRPSAAARSTARSARCGGPTARSRASAPWRTVVSEIVELRRRGFRFILLADDNFYPVTLADLAMAGAHERIRSSSSRWPRCDRSDSTLMARLEQLPEDLVFYTQITMEAAEDTEFLDAMRRARIRGRARRRRVGDARRAQGGLQGLQHGGRGAGHAAAALSASTASTSSARSSSACRPTGRPRFWRRRTLAQRAGVTFAQFVMLTPLPGTLDFGRWESEPSADVRVQDIPLSRYWLIPSAARPRIYAPHPAMSADQIRQGTQATWDSFYSLSHIWQRSSCVSSLEGAAGIRADFEAVPADVREHRDSDRQRTRRAVREARPGAGTARAASLRDYAHAGARNPGRPSTARPVDTSRPARGATRAAVHCRGICGTAGRRGAAAGVPAGRLDVRVRLTRGVRATGLDAGTSNRSRAPAACRRRDRGRALRRARRRADLRRCRFPGAAPGNRSSGPAR